MRGPVIRGLFFCAGFRPVFQSDSYRENRIYLRGRVKWPVGW